MAQPSPLRPTTLRLLSCLLILAALLLSPAAAWAKGCAENLPGAVASPPLSTLWGELQPESILVDATRFTGSERPDTRLQVSTSVDIENGWIFHTFYGGFSVWDGRTNPGQPQRMALIGGWERQFPSWPGLTEFSQIVFSIDAPEGIDSIAAVAAIAPVGMTIWDTTNKSTPRALYQDKGKTMYQVHSARIGGRDYAFGADPLNDQGLHIYDMTAARSFSSSACVEDRSRGQNNCPGVYVGRIGDRETVKYVHGLTVGSRHFVAKSGGYASGAGLQIWEVTNPRTPQLVVQDFRGAEGETFGVALWSHNGNHYLAVRHNADARFFDITTCLTSGCSGLKSLQIGPSLKLKAYTESLHWLSAVFSRSDATPFVYFGNHDTCRQGEEPGRTEYLFDVSNPAVPREVVDPNRTLSDNGETVDYWSWYYSTYNRGFSHFGPRFAKFDGPYLYRAGGTIFDVHKWTGAPSGPPVADFDWNPKPVYAGDPIAFTSLSTGRPDSYQWTFQDGTPSSSTSGTAGVTFSSPGAKSVSLTANKQGQPSDTETKTITVLNPAPGVGNITVSPADPRVCQRVTLTAQNVTGKAPLTIGWEVSGGNLPSPATSSVNPFTWDTTGRSAGTYTVGVKVSKTGYNDAVSSTTVTLAPLQALPAAGSFTPSNDTFVAGTVKFSVNVPDATEWKWDFGDGTVTEWLSDPNDGPRPTHTYTTTGTKTVKVWVRNCAEGGLNGFQSGNLTVNITQIAPLKINNFKAQGCGDLFCDFSPGTSVTFTVEVEGNPTQYEYDWNGDGFGSDNNGVNGADDQVSTTPVTTHTYTAQRTYTPRLRLRRGAEISEVWIHMPSIGIFPGAGGGGNNGGGNTPSVTVSGPTSGQIGLPYNYNVTSSNCTAGNWTWSATPDGTLASNGSTVSITWPTAGTKTVQATSSGTCPSVTRSVTISNPNPSGMTAEFTFMPASPQIGQTVSFNGSGSTGNPAIWFWEFGDGGTAFGPTVTYAYQSGGPFTVKLTVSKDCASGSCTSQASTTRVVTVASGPQLSASFDTSATCSIDITGERCEARVGQAVAFTATGTGATSYSWSFGDGTATGPQVVHTWTTPGPYTVQLTVGNGTTTASVSRLFIVSGEPPRQTKSVVLPWIAQTRGALNQSSDLYVHNPTSAPVEVKLQFRRRGVPESTPPEAVRTIQPGATLFVADVLDELFHRENVAGFVTVVVENGAMEPVINSFNTTFQTDGSQFGQTVPGISLSRATSAASSDASSRVQHLVGLNDNDDRLAYFGLSNPGEQTVSYRLRFFNKLGHQIGQPANLAVGGFTQKQFQVREIREQFGITDIEDYRVEIETTSGGRIFPYGANLRRASEDPSFVGAGSSADSKVYLVGALSSPGLNNSLWQSDIVLSNTGTDIVLSDMWFTPVGTNTNPTQKVTLTLQPGETQRLVNVIADKWGIKNAAGVLILDSDAPKNIFPVVQGESYDNSKPSKKFGQTIPAFTDADAAGAGRTHYLVGLRQDDKNRTTYWLFNPGTTTGEYEVIYRALDGSILGKLDVLLGAGRARQVSPSQHPIPKTGVPGGFSVQVKVKNGKVLSAAQVVNNATNDPAYVKGELR